ncbi:hypothetical protein ACHAWF_010270 [Thalassiosira exigua]
MGNVKTKIQDKNAAFKEDQHAREEGALGPPSKTMDASEYSQELVMLVAKTIEQHLGLIPAPGKRRSFKATQMIQRELIRNPHGVYNEQRKNDGIMYYIKVKTDVEAWPWVFVKLFEPPLITGVSRVTFREMKKMKEDYKLVTF